MASIPNITVEQLAQAFQELSLAEKVKLFSLLPEDWFAKKNHKLSNSQKEALKRATKKEEEGKSSFISWEEVEKFVKTRNEQ